MYTRSFPSRRGVTSSQLPPDYGGTALVVNHSESSESQPRALTLGRGGGAKERPREPFLNDERNVPPVPPFPPPFGVRGQDEARQAPAAFHHENEDDVCPIDENENGSPSVPSFLDPSNLKSDDLLLLGLALLFFTDKEFSDGEFPTDALLILAMLYLSGL